MTPLVELAPPVVEEIIHRAGRPDLTAGPNNSNTAATAPDRCAYAAASSTNRRLVDGRHTPPISPDDEPEAVAVSKASVPLPFPLYAIDSRCVWCGFGALCLPLPIDLQIIAPRSLASVATACAPGRRCRPQYPYRQGR